MTDDITDNLTEFGIEFNYKIRNYHDCCIKTDTGWTIILGRGLDIFEKYSPYSIASSCCNVINYKKEADF